MARVKGGMGWGREPQVLVPTDEKSRPGRRLFKGIGRVLT